jgi:hypothetical protein
MAGGEPVMADDLNIHVYRCPNIRCPRFDDTQLRAYTPGEWASGNNAHPGGVICDKCGFEVTYEGVQQPA